MSEFDGGDPHGLVFHPGQLREHASAVLLAKDFADYLEKAYPGWLWAISVDPRGGVTSLRSMLLSGEYGVILKLDWVQHDPRVAKKLVLNAAAEILERFGMPVGPFDKDAFHAGPKDVAGRPKPDLSDKHQRIRRQHRDEALTAAVKSGEVTIRYEDTRVESGTHRRILIASGYRKREEPQDVSSR